MSPSFSQTGQGGEREGGQSATASSSSSSTPARTSRLAAFIPALARPATEDLGADLQRLSVNEQIAQSRRNASSSSSSSALAPRTVPPHLLASQASTSVGVHYLTSAALKASDTRQKQRDALLKRSLAGPAPPTSWKEDLLQKHADARAGKMNSGTEADCEAGPPVKARRRKIMSQWRAIRDEKGLGSDLSDDMSLRDMALTAVADLICTTHRDSPHREAVLEMQDCLALLPPHLQSQVLILLGQEARADSAVTQSLLWCLAPFADEIIEDGEEEEAVATSMTNEHTAAGDLSDDEWDAEDPSDSHDSSAATSSFSLTQEAYLDLSFAQITRDTLSSLLSPAGPGKNVHLRSLSLAGCRILQRPQRGHSTGMPSLSIVSSSLLRLLAQVPNLTELCLAGCEFRLDSHEDQGAFWRKFWLSCPRLKVLDLSYATQLAAGQFESRYSGHLNRLALRGAVVPDDRFIGTSVNVALRSLLQRVQRRIDAQQTPSDGDPSLAGATASLFDFSGLSDRVRAPPNGMGNSSAADWHLALLCHAVQRRQWCDIIA